jgi:hypothetical protein
MRFERSGMSNVNYKEVKAGGHNWQQKAEEHAASGTSFSVRPFNKQMHWPFLEGLCKQFDLVGTFDARARAAYFDARSKQQFSS